MDDVRIQKALHFRSFFSILCDFTNINRTKFKRYSKIQGKKIIALDWLRSNVGGKIVYRNNMASRWVDEAEKEKILTLLTVTCFPGEYWDYSAPCDYTY